MKSQLFYIFFLICNSITLAQSGTIKGVIEEDNGPLPGASLVIKGTTTGTQTDFDGNYTLDCTVGDIIVVSYIGYSSWEFEVSIEMMGLESATHPVKKEAVQTITNNAFSDGIAVQQDSLVGIPALQNTAYGYTHTSGYGFTDIKDITNNKKVYSITTNDPRTAFEINLNTYTGIENVALSGIYNANTFESPVFSTHSISAGLYKDGSTALEINGSYATHSDFYGLTQNSKRRVQAKYETVLGSWKLSTQAGANGSRQSFANLNGFQNKILQQVASDQNLDIGQLFENLESQEINAEYSALGSIAKDLTTWLAFNSSINTIYSNKEEASNQNALTDNLNLLKKWNNVTWQSNTSFNTDIDLSEEINFTTSTQFKINQYSIDFIGLDRNDNTFFQTSNLSKFTTEFNNTITLDYNNYAYLTLANNSFTSSLQNDEWLIPNAVLSIVPTHFIYDLQGNFINYISFTGRYSSSIKETPLRYANSSHNTLLIDENQLNDFSNKIELFADPSIALEQSNGFEITSTLKLADRDISIDFSYSQNNHENVVFPILENNTFILSNVANTETKGFDTDISANLLHGYDKDLDWRAGLTFSRKRTITTQVTNGQSKIPISGLRSVNGNLIAGEVVGIITDRNGLIIGDPTPNFNLTHYQEFKTGSLKWQFYLDFQSGGDLWNARGSALDNTQQSDQSFLEDSSYLSLSSLQVSYEFIKKSNSKTCFFRNLRLSASLNNLLLWSAFDEASPYSNILDTALGNSFQLYNTPNTSTIGFKITTKI